jgi:ABC-2 type transport system ATP-binding protein
MIRAEGLTKRLRGRAVVSDVSFRCEPGTVTGFLGPNGAGKTTTMRMLVGLSEPDSGEAWSLGGRYRDLPNPGRRVGILLDASAQHAGRRGRDALAVSAQMMGVPAQRVDTLLELVGLDETAAPRRVGQYSLGMRQRLGFAHALLGVLILDEPANGLDPEGMRWMRELLRGFADRGGTVLLSSHLLTEVEAVADRMMIIGSGRIQAQGTRAELLTKSGTIVEADDLATLDAALDRAGLAMHPADGDRRLVEAQPEVIARLAMANDIVLRRLAPAEEAGLEGLFFELTTADGNAPSPKTSSIHPEPAGATASAAPPSPHRSAWTPPASTRAPASAASSPSSCARWSTPAPASGSRSPWWPSRSSSWPSAAWSATRPTTRSPLSSTSGCSRRPSCCRSSASCSSHRNGPSAPG